MKNRITKISAVTFSLLLPLSVFAAVTVGIQNPLQNVTSIPTFISNVLGQVVKIGGIVAIFAFIWSGFMFVKAQGNPSELKTAKDIFINTCIGVAVLLGAQLIASIIVGTLNTLK